VGAIFVVRGLDCLIAFLGFEHKPVLQRLRRTQGRRGAYSGTR
jgi:hypothetical protein